MLILRGVYQELTDTICGSHILSPSDWRISAFALMTSRDFTCRKQGRIPSIKWATKQKTGRILSIESWLFNRNPFVMVYYIPHPYNNGSLYSPFTWVVKPPIYPKTTRCFFSLLKCKSTLHWSWMPVALQGTKINACLVVRHSVQAGRSEAKVLMNRCIYWIC